VTLIISQNEKYNWNMPPNLVLMLTNVCRLRKYCSSLRRKVGNMKEVADGMLYKASISNIVCLFLRALGA
jgi:hypothetical protein